jgi:hypothetical protein
MCYVHRPWLCSHDTRLARGRAVQNQFNIWWGPSAQNLADCFTKHNTPAHLKGIHMKYIYVFSVCNNVTSPGGELDPCVAIWAFQYVSPYCLICGPTCEAMKYIFGFVLINSDKKLSMSCPSINIFGCRRDVILYGIVETMAFFSAGALNVSEVGSCVERDALIHFHVVRMFMTYCLVKSLRLIIYLHFLTLLCKLPVC